MDRFDFSVRCVRRPVRGPRRIDTPLGTVRTPAFMPVGTARHRQGDAARIVWRETGADIILGNTYHLMLRPTAERIASLGGLHRFMNWDGPIPHRFGRVPGHEPREAPHHERGGRALRPPHIDGSRHLLTPERSMEIQRLLGSDIVMAFERVPGAARDRGGGGGEHAPLDALGRAVARRLRRRAGTRAVRHPAGRGHAGSARRERGGVTGDRLFDGYAVGGLAVGEGQAAMLGVLETTPATCCPADRPRYLMGVGKPDDIVLARWSAGST